MSTSPAARFTEEQYLEMERIAEYKSEFDNGEIISMAGASFEHINVAANLFRELQDRLRATSYRAFMGDCRIKINDGVAHLYPDIAIFHGAPEFADQHRDSFMNPSIIVEVLSPSSARYDLGRKFRRYRKLSSLRGYILVFTDAVAVQSFVLREPHWTLSFYQGREAVLPIEAANVEIPLSAIYANVDITEELD